MDIHMPVKKTPGNRTQSTLREVITTCLLDCGGACPLKVHVRDGVIEKISIYDDGHTPPIQACEKGLLYHHRVYAKARIRYPMQRVGRRGAGEFTRISWDEAIAIISTRLKQVIATHGPEAILECEGVGAFKGVLKKTIAGPMSVLFDALGGRTVLGTNNSFEGAMWAKKYTYGGEGFSDASSMEDLLNSRLIVLWALNLAETQFGSTSLYWLKRARDQGIRIILVDPCYTDTGQLLKAEWVPVRPGTDTALLNALAYVIITKNLYDAEYVATHVQGFDAYKAYLLGASDTTPKTPEWASPITGVSPSDITRLAQDIATAKPTAIIQGWAPGRTANGEQYHRAALALQAITGNIGVSGGSGSCCAIESHPEELKQIYSALRIYTLPKGNANLRHGGKGVEIKKGLWADAVLKGRKGGFPSDIKLLYIIGSNILNQNANVAKSIQALQAAEFIVCHEQMLTPTAKYADILLPITTNFEEEDISTSWVKDNYLLFANKVIDPLWEAKSDLDIARLLAKALGIPNFYPESNDTILRRVYTKAGLPSYLSYEDFKKQGILRLPHTPVIAFKDHIQDPTNNPFPTPSGKIELAPTHHKHLDPKLHQFSAVIRDYPKIPSVPTFSDHPELPHSPRAKQYPLQLTTPHHRHLVNSQGSQFEGIKNLYKHEIWIHPDDATPRHIADGDLVHVFNDHGTIEVPAKVTTRMMPGVVRCYQGAWYHPGPDGVDHGGNVNILTDETLTSPAGAANCNTCLVEIRLKPKGKKGGRGEPLLL